MVILVLNCGRSSIKFQVINPETEERLISGLMSEIGTPRASFEWEKVEQRHEETCADITYEAGISLILETISSGAGQVIDSLEQLDGVGHRVVHGGEAFADSTLITPEVESAIEAVIPLAPLHNPANLLGIRVCESLLPDSPQVAVFDTAFHQTLPRQAYLYALPYELYEEHGIRRYGFHGTSHRYVSERAAEIMGEQGNFITLHLGNGASVTAVLEGKSVDTSMGLTPLEGLVMGTRSGDIDPSLVPFIVENTGLTLDETERLLNKKSGLYGLSGGQSDMKVLLERAEQGDEASQRAIDVFCYRAKKYIGAYMAVLGKVDAIVFTGGIGENAAAVRAQICAGLEPYGIEIDLDANEHGKERAIISREGTPTTVLVIPTDEELMIALDTYRIIQG
ncbi:MAG: acetate kinase [Chloroflexota bacterium]|nr:acetate kinase [Chloroflexota bacterium]